MQVAILLENQNRRGKLEVIEIDVGIILNG